MEEEEGDPLFLYDGKTAPSIEQPDIEMLSVSHGIIKKLYDAGYHHFDDFQGQDAVSLAKDCGISHKEAVEVLKQVRETSNINKLNPLVSSTIKTQSAFEAFQKHKDRKSIITFSKDIDNLLKGGIPMGQTSEICGVPGVGKTQLALQLAVNVQLPKVMDGCEGKCLYVDTEGSFMTERLEQIATAFVKHIHRMANYSSNDPELMERRKKAAEEITVDNVLENVHYFRVYNLLEQLSFIYILEEYVKQHGIKLIIFDSISFHFRHDLNDFNDSFQRNRLLQGMAAKLSQIANEYDIAIVCLNQVTTRLDKDGNNSHLAPALGLTWSSACTNHFFLEFDRGERYFRVNKSSNIPPRREKFSITADGFRSASQQPNSFEEQEDSPPTESRKRPREQE
jgi:RAD51-like protein 2